MNKERMLLRTAALELQDADLDVVKLAGLGRKIKNVWEALKSKKYRQKLNELRNKAPEVQHLSNNVNKIINDLESSIADSDIPSLGDNVEKLRATIPQLDEKLEELEGIADETSKQVPVGIVDSQGNVYTEEEYIQNVQRGYRQDKPLLERLFNQLPDEVKQEIPIGRKVNIPIQ